MRSPRDGPSSAFFRVLWISMVGIPVVLVGYLTILGPSGSGLRSLMRLVPSAVPPITPIAVTLPSSPHINSVFIVGLGSAMVSFGTYMVAAYRREFPGRVHRWPSILSKRLVGTLRNPGRETIVWIGLFVLSVVVSILHYGGIHHHIYTRYYWWDLLTHGASGSILAAIIFLTFSTPSTPGTPGTWIALTVVSIGAGFEVYEFLFKTFWYQWSLSYYVTDTAIDILMTGLGGLLGYLIFETVHEQHLADGH